jgi:Raf kinase inhibitor-like YbhB/YbcL family protein
MRYPNEAVAPIASSAPKRTPHICAGGSGAAHQLLFESQQPMSLKLTSSAFQNEGLIPDRHSKQGGNVSPQLSWTGVPEDTVSLALIVDDPDAPSGVFVHWVLYNISPGTTELEEHQPSAPELSNGACQGINGFGEQGYGGPQPPSGTHRYVFHLYALDTDTDVPAGLTRQELDGAIEGHVIEEAQLIGRYQHRTGSRAA